MTVFLPPLYKCVLHEGPRKYACYSQMFVLGYASGGGVCVCVGGVEGFGIIIARAKIQLQHKLTMTARTRARE